MKNKSVQEELDNEDKEKITSQPVLFLLKRKGKFKMKTDTLGHTIRGVFSQE